ncbi:MAG: STM4011 family radical SAM protein [Candidatus Eremiobacterota bacterium]
MELTLLYRGPLSGCNYDCPYCPFAKRRESRTDRERDERALERFLAWVEDQRHRRLSVFFTPWGEALVRACYRRALVRLTGLSHVRRAVIQTNLSCGLDWVHRCDRSRLALWCSFHPGQVDRKRFLSRCLELHAEGVSFSVGVVGLREHLEPASLLRAELPPEVYLWVNAFKRLPGYYSRDEAAAWTALDPLFPLNHARHPSLGRPCHTGERVVSVDGDGVMRRCHFVPEPIGNLYAPDWESALRPRTCPNETCGCHIGYVHMPELRLEEVFGDGLLERIPVPQESASVSPKFVE